MEFFNNQKNKTMKTTFKSQSGTIEHLTQIALQECDIEVITTDVGEKRIISTSCNKINSASTNPTKLILTGTIFNGIGIYSRYVVNFPFPLTKGAEKILSVLKEVADKELKKFNEEQ
jgi:hypothetical protein